MPHPTSPLPRSHHHERARSGGRARRRGLTASAALALVAASTGCGTTPSPSPSASPSATTTPAVAARADLPAPPPPGAAVDYQLGGPYEPSPDIGVVTRDPSAGAVPGRYSICYLNAFQTQPEDAAWWRAHHPDLLLRTADGSTVEDAGWPGELLLDTSTAEDRAGLLAVVGPWVDECAAQGFDAVEADNLDAWTRSDGLLDREGALAFAALLGERARADGLALGQKNAAELTAADVARVGFGFAVAEECEVYEECDRYAELYGDAVIEVEYTDNGREAYRRACALRGGTTSVVLRDRDVLPRGVEGHVAEHC